MHVVVAAADVGDGAYGCDWTLVMVHMVVTMDVGDGAYGCDWT